MRRLWVVDNNSPYADTVAEALRAAYAVTRFATLSEVWQTQTPAPEVLVLCAITPEISGLESFPCPVLLLYTGAPPQVLPPGVDSILPFPQAHPELLAELMEISLHTLEGAFTFRRERWYQRNAVALLQQREDWLRILQAITEKLGHYFAYEHMGIFLREGDELVLVAEGGSDMNIHVGYRQPLQVGLIGWVAREGQPLRVPDVQQDPRYYAPTPSAIRSAALYPIMMNQAVVGVLGAESSRADAFPPEACLILEVASVLLGMAVQQAQELRLQASWQQLLNALLELIPALLASENLDTLLQHIAQMAVDLIGSAEAGCVLLKETDGFHFRAVVGYDETLKTLVLPLDNHFVADLQRGRVIHVRHIARVDEALLSDEVTARLHELGRTAEIEETLVAPLLVRGELLGYITVDSFNRQRIFTPEDEVMLGLFASMAAVAVREARLRQTEHEWQALVQTLQALGVRLSGTLDEEEIIRSLGQHLQGVIPAHTIIIMMFENDILYLRYGYGLLPHVEEELRRMPLRRYPLAMEAFQTREGILVPDTAHEPRWVVMNGAQRLSVLVVPFRTQEAVLGFLTLTLDRPHGYTQEHLTLLQSLADVVASALDNARNYAASRRRAEYLEALRRLALQTGSQLDPGAIIEAALQQAMSMTQASGALFYTCNPHTGELSPVRWAGKRSVYQAMRIKPGAGIVGQVWLQRQLVLVDDYATWPDRLDIPNLDTIHMTIGLPVIWQDQPLGVLVVFHEDPQRRYSATDLNVLLLLTQQFAGSLYAAQLYQGLLEQRDQLAALAQIDQKIIALADNSAEVMRVILEQALELLHLPAGLIALMELASAPVVYAQGFSQEQEIMRSVQQCWMDRRLVYHRLGPEGYQAFSEVEAMSCEVGFAGQEETRAALVLPLWIRHYCAGALYLFDRQVHHWSLEEIELARMLARQASIALEKALLVSELQRRLTEMQLLNRLGQMAASTLDPDEILRRTCSETRQFLRADAVLVGKIEQRGLRVLVADGDAFVSERLGDYLRLERVESLHLGLQEQRFIFVSVLSENDPVLGALAAEMHIRSVVMVPLWLRGELQGVVLAISRSANYFRQRDVTLLSAVANTIVSPLDNARLYQEAQEARRRVEEAYESLRNLDALKSQFIQNVSHELRTPLAIVKGYLDIALDRSAGLALPEELQHVFMAMNTYTERLVTLEESITAIEDTSLGELDLRPASLLAVLQVAMRAVQQYARRRHITFHVELPETLPQVVLDEQQLARAFEHLLDNAIKFNHEGGHVWVRAGVRDAQVWIEIQDDGIGIPANELERIFERFYQVDGSSTRRYGGLGLGLALVREVITRHGGKIWATSAGPQQGATLTVLLPIYEARHG